MCRFNPLTFHVWLLQKVVGPPGKDYTQTDGNSTTHAKTYRSGLIHAVEVDLKPSTTYYYKACHLLSLVHALSHTLQMQSRSH